MSTATLNRKIGDVQCRVAGCQAPGFISKLAESTHFHRVHSGKILVPKQKRRFAKAALLSGGDKKSNGHMSKKRGPYQSTRFKLLRRLEELQNASAQAKPLELMRTPHFHVQHVGVHFCPIDGTDLLAVAAALAAKGITKPVIGCPTCLTDLRKVAQFIATSNVSQI